MFDIIISLISIVTCLLMFVLTVVYNSIINIKKDIDTINIKLIKVEHNNNEIL